MPFNAQCARQTSYCIMYLLLLLVLGASTVSSQENPDPLTGLLDVHEREAAEIAFPGCRLCGWSMNCTRLCAAAGEECEGVAEDGEDSCVLNFPRSGLPSDWAHKTGRTVSSNTSYRIHKDVLSDLLHRISQMKRIRSQGRPAVSAGLPPSEQLLMRNIISMTFPRLNLLIQFLWGQALPFKTICCHQECHWEEHFRVRSWQLVVADRYAEIDVLSRTMPTLKSLLSHSVDTHLKQAHDPYLCKSRGYNSMYNSGQGLLGRFMADMEQAPSWRVIPWLAEQITTMTWKDNAYTVSWVVAPALVMAHDTLREVATTDPMIVLVTILIAGATTLAEWHLVVRILTDRQLSLTDRFICISSSSLLVSTVIILLIGLASALLPIMDIRTAHFILWLHLLLLPAGQVVLMHLARRLHHSHHKMERTWVRSEIRRLRRQMEQLQVTTNSPSATAAAAALAAAATAARRGSRSRAGGGGAVREGVWREIPGGLLADFPIGMGLGANYMGGGGPPEGDLDGLDDFSEELLLSMFEQFLFPQERARRGGRATTRAAAQPQQAGGAAAPRRAPGEIRREREWDRPQPVQVPGIEGLEGFMGASMLEQLLRNGRDSRLRAHADNQDAGMAAVTDQGVLSGNNSPRAERGQHVHAARTGEGGDVGVAGGSGGGALRSPTPGAAVDSVHWPPPLELPVWVDESTTVPHAFRCPITLCVMREPAQASSGLTYEHHAILEWLSHHKVDPVTQLPLKKRRLTPNLNLRHMIEEWVAAQGQESKAKTD